jgi:hypothetical protein
MYRKVVFRQAFSNSESVSVHRSSPLSLEVYAFILADYQILLKREKDRLQLPTILDKRRIESPGFTEISWQVLSKVQPFRDSPGLLPSP